MKLSATGTLGAACALAFSLVTGAAGAGEGDAKLVDLEKSFWAAWAKGDAGLFESGLVKEAVNVTPGGIMVGRDALVKDIKSGTCKVASYELGDMQVVRPADNVAILVYSASQDAVCDGHPVPTRVHSTSVFVKKDGHWKAAAYSETAAM